MPMPPHGRLTGPERVGPAVAAGPGRETGRTRGSPVPADTS